MLAKALACFLCGDGPKNDTGSQVVRVSDELRKRLKVDIGCSILIEKFEVIPAREIKIEWYYKTPKRHLNQEFIHKVSRLLHEYIFQDLADLPIMEKDRFSINLTFPNNPDNNINLVY